MNEDFIEVDGRKYVSMERYQELGAWATGLQRKMEQMQERLDFLEEKDEQLRQFAIQSKANIERIIQAEHDKYIPYLEKRPAFSDSGFVYVIRDIEVTGFYKIGRTVKIQDRFRQFAAALPFKCEFVFHIPTLEMCSLESRLHRKFADKRKNGEWFDLNEADLKYIRSLRAY